MESMTLMVKFDNPGLPLGLPETNPVDVFNTKPDGSDPETIENVYGGDPPLAKKA